VPNQRYLPVRCSAWFMQPGLVWCGASQLDCQAWNPGKFAEVRSDHCYMNFECAVCIRLLSFEPATGVTTCRVHHARFG
jgi:hypothetical protein